MVKIHGITPPCMCCVMHLLKIKSCIVTNDVKSSLSDMMM